MATDRQAVKMRSGIERPGAREDRDDARRQLLAGIPVTERRLELAGIRSAVLEGGEGPPVVLLHGPGESAVNWRWVIPPLVETHRVIAPDLPAHGSTEAPDDLLDADRVLAWLGELIDRTSDSSPALVGMRSEARSARASRSRQATCSAAWCSSSPSAWLAFAPRRGSHSALAASWRGRASAATSASCGSAPSISIRSSRGWGGDGSRSPPTTSNSRARRSQRSQASCCASSAPQIPPEALARITVPTSLIWGRHDRANRPRIAEFASERYGWPLHVIEESADDPARDQPEAFLHALHIELGRTVTGMER